MDFPQDCLTDSDRCRYALGEVEKLMAEHRAKGAAARAGDISVAEFRAWERNDWMARHRATQHVANIYLERVGLGPKANESDSDVNSRSAQIAALRASARDAASIARSP